MKKIIATILTIVLATTCLFSATVATSAADVAIPEGLVMAYDFEGDEAVVLKDKATGGSAADDFTVYTDRVVGLDKVADYTVENGVLTVGKLTKFRAPKASADLQNISAYTIYLKVKITGDYANDWLSILTINQIFRVYISGEKEDGTYTVLTRDGFTNAASEYIHADGVSFKKDQWLYLAYTFELGADGAKAANYISTDGVNYNVAYKDVAVKNVLNQTSITEFGWNKLSDTVKMSYDDIFVFNRVLTADEVKTLANVDLPAPAVETEPVETQPAETQAPETQAPETQAPETQAPETQAPDTKPVDTKAPETQAPDTKPSDSKPADTDAPKSGCGATVGIASAIVAVAALGMAVCAKKKEN